MDAKYSDKQIADIRDREQKALAYLKELHLTPACSIVKEKLDVEEADVFGDRLYPYLQDIKYVRQGNEFVEQSIPSPYVNTK